MIKRNILYNFIYQILIYIIPLITTPYLSRILDADGVGEYSFAYSVAVYFAMFGILGLSNYGNREIANISHNKTERSKVFWDIYSMQIITGGLAFLFYCVYIFVSPEKSVIKIFMAFYVLASVFDISWFFFGMEIFKLTIFRNSVLKVSTCLLIFLLVKTREDVWLYGAIMAIGNLLCQLLLWPYLKKYVNPSRLNFKSIKYHILPNLKLFIPVIFVSVYKIMDKIMLGILSNNTQVGYYESSERLLSIPVCLITAMGIVMLPRVTNMLSKKEVDGIKKLTRISIWTAIISSNLICFGIIEVLNEFIPLFYGDGFSECKKILWIMLPSAIFVAQANVIRTQILIPFKCDKVYIVSAIIGAGINLIANFILIPRMYAAGAAVGTLLSEIVVWAYQSIKVKHVINLTFDYIASIPVFLVGISMAVLFDNLSFVHTSLIQILILKIFIGGLYFIVIVGVYILYLRYLYKRYKKDLIKNKIAKK